MSSDTTIRQPSLEEVIAHLITPPAENSESHNQLVKVQQSAASLQNVSGYGEYLKGAWNGTQTPNLVDVKIRLLADALRLNKLIQDQLKLANDSQALQEELQTAWSAAEANAKIAREMFQKAKVLTDQKEELLRVLERNIVQKNEQGIRELLTKQHNELLGQIGLSAAERQELDRFRAQAISDLSSKLDGIQLTTNGIAQSISNIVNAEQSAEPDLKEQQ